ncbi:MAG: protocatechuate 3,4-dioxygenase, partial [Cystobacter sp.]
MTRRQLLEGLGLTMMAVPISHLLACEGQRPGPSGTGWATGGTAAMTGTATYPNPFTSETGTACTLTCEQILGPCYAPTLFRKDISEGQDGLPVRLALRVLDEACKPITGASVDIWHSSPEGVYSAEEVHPFCNPDNARVRASR